MYLALAAWFCPVGVSDTRTHAHTHAHVHARKSDVCRLEEKLEPSDISSCAKVETSSISSWTVASPEQQITEHQPTGALWEVLSCFKIYYF